MYSFKQSGLTKKNYISLAFLNTLVLLFLVYCFFMFAWELYNYQIVFLPPIWHNLSFVEQATVNLNLGLMDLKIVFAAIGIVLAIYTLKNKIKRG